jgi:hypothetical protein
MYKVFLVDDKNGNSYERLAHADKFDCEVYVAIHCYEVAKGCHYEIEYV